MWNIATEYVTEFSWFLRRIEAFDFMFKSDLFLVFFAGTINEKIRSGILCLQWQFKLISARVKLRGFSVDMSEKE